jgi:hypothetical protein
MKDGAIVMERDVGAPPPIQSLVPLIAAVAMPVVAAGLSAAGQLPHVAVLLSLAGLILAGWLASRSPESPIAWGIVAVSALIASFGFPADWDSYRMVARIGMVAALVATALAASPVLFRKVIVSFVILFHFLGILCATTWPPRTPWITDQLANRIFQPYLKFLYLGNAYHFYSPEPGPASHLYFLITFEKRNERDPTGKPTVEYQWETLPNRPEQVRDPLALTYYRRLAITEHTAASTPDALQPQTFEKSEAYTRRMQVHAGTWPGYPRIPIAPQDLEPWGVQYKVPTPMITSYILPSYTRHVAYAYSTPDRVAVKVRAYRLEHRIIQQQHLKAGFSPFDPVSYRVYFLGDYTPAGELIDPQDPMLFWLIPIVPKYNAPAGEKNYEDYLEKHANVEVKWRRP